MALTSRTSHILQSMTDYVNSHASFRHQNTSRRRRQEDRGTADARRWRLHRVLSPPGGEIPPCSRSRSQELTVGDFLFSAPLCFISHVPTKTDATCGRGNLSCIPSAFGNMVHLTLRAFIAGLIEFWSLFISQHIKQTNSKYKYALFIVSLRFISHGYDLCSVLVLSCNKKKKRKKERSNLVS